MRPPLRIMRTRNDTEGSGEFGARRSGRRHLGRDYVVLPGEPVYAPISGDVREGQCYPDDARYRLVEIVGERTAVRLLYVEPSVRTGDTVTEGDQIGVAQDLRARYGAAMTPHLHVEVISDPELAWRPATVERSTT